MELVRTKVPLKKEVPQGVEMEEVDLRSRELIISKILEDPVAYIQQVGLSLFEFMQVFWNEASEDDFHPNWHIELLCDELETIAYQVGDQKPKLHDLLINIPPGTTKTITCSIMFPVWCWTKWHWMRFITCSYSGTLALESALKSRDIIRSDKFKTLFPQLGIKEDSDIKSNYRIYKEEIVHEGHRPRINYGGNRYSTSVGGTLTGFHGHIIIVDDPLNPSQAASEIELQKANYWIERTLSTRKTDKRVTPTVLVMQRLNQCLLPNTRILGEDGFIEIQHAVKGGSVLTSAGWQKIEETANKKYKGTVIGFDLVGHPEIPWVTSNHRVYTEKGWVEAGDITLKDILLFPIQKRNALIVSELAKYWPEMPFEDIAPKVFKKNFVGNEERVPKEELQGLISSGLTSTEIAKYFGFKNRQVVDLYIAKYGIVRKSALKVSENILEDVDFWRVVGYWLAEGCFAKGRRGINNSVIFSFGNGDAELIQDTVYILQKHGINAIVSDTKFNTYKLQCSSYQLALFLELFGSGAAGKHLPDWVLTLPKNYFSQLLRGYWLGDGCVIRNAIRLSSVSLKLLSDIQRGLLNLGVVSSIYDGNKNQKPTIIKTGPGKGRIIQSKLPSYELRAAKKDINPLFWVSDIPTYTKNTKNKIKDGWLHVKINNILEKQYEGIVHDITTPCHDFLSGLSMLHNSDPSGYLLAKEKKNIKHICLPGEIREYREQLTPSDLSKFYIDDLLDPVRITWDVLEELKTDLGQYGYAGQIGQNPVPPGGGMFKVDNFFVFDSIPSSNPIMHEVRYWDKAATSNSGAYTVGVKMARLRDGKFIVIDVKRGQWAAELREKKIRNTAEMDGRACLVGLEQEPGSGGKESAEATVRNLAGFRVEVERPTGDKVYRADPYSVQVNYGNVYLLRGEWNKAFIEEYRFFPFGTYKDQVDAGSGAFNRLVNKKVARRLV